MGNIPTTVGKALCPEMLVITSGAKQSTVAAMSGFNCKVGFAALNPSYARESYLLFSVVRALRLSGRFKDQIRDHVRVRYQGKMA